jgi:hypothetical protein
MGREDGNANRTGRSRRRTAHIEDAGLQEPRAATRALVIRFWWPRRNAAQFIHGVRDEIAASPGVSNRSEARASAMRALLVDGASL